MHKEEESHTDLGIIRIHDNVIASIASLAACEIAGVKAIAKSLGSSLLDLIHKKNVSAIKVEKDKNGEITIQIPLVIKYDFNIPEIANKVQDNVRNTLEKMTNLSIKNINIIVQGIEKG